MNLSFFRRVRRVGSETMETASGPCGCSPPAYCPTARNILVRVDRGERLAGQWGSWDDYHQAIADLAFHLGRLPSEVRAMLRHATYQEGG